MNLLTRLLIQQAQQSPQSGMPGMQGMGMPGLGMPMSPMQGLLGQAMPMPGADGTDDLTRKQKQHLEAKQRRWALMRMGLGTLMPPGM